MGCAECKLLRLLKFENCIEELIGVDMDTNAMYHNRRHLEPLTTDYIFRRPRPLRVRLMKGSFNITMQRYIYIYIYISIYLPFSMYTCQALLLMQTLS